MHFEQVKSILIELETPYIINPKMVRGLDYYTKTAFEITSGQLGAQDAILGGGRYDDLFKELGGPETPGIGFAAGMERIILHLTADDSESQKILMVAYHNPALLPQANKLCKQLRDLGYRVYVDYNGKNLKKQFKKSDRIGASFTLILGEDEIKNNTISIKNMALQKQENIKRGELEAWLKNHL